MKRKLLLIVIVLIGILHACKKDKVEPVIVHTSNQVVTGTFVVIAINFHNGDYVYNAKVDIYADEPNSIHTIKYTDSLGVCTLHPDTSLNYNLVIQKDTMEYSILFKVNPNTPDTLRAILY